MSIFIPVIILILVALILSFLQFSPSLFSFFYHYALGKYSHSKADNLALDYILGAETISAIVWFAIYVIFFAIFYHNPNLSSSIIPWIITGILCAESVFAFFFYFRKGKSTALYVSRSAANTFLNDTKKVTSRREAFMLGFMSKVPELIFTIPIYLLIVYILAYSTFIPSAITIIFFIIISTIPLFIIRTIYRAGCTLADIQGMRTKTKLFIRLTLTISLLLLTIATSYLGIAYYG